MTFKEFCLQENAPVVEAKPKEPIEIASEQPSVYADIQELKAQMAELLKLQNNKPYYNKKEGGKQ